MRRRGDGRGVLGVVWCGFEGWADKVVEGEEGGLSRRKRDGDDGLVLERWRCRWNKDTCGLDVGDGQRENNAMHVPRLCV